MTTKIVSSSDGPQITVNELLKDPLRIPTLIVDMAKQGFLADSLFRKAGVVESGAVLYHTETSPYADDDSAIRAEFGEVPVASTSVGDPRVAWAVERALALVVSDTMKRRNDVDAVNRQFTQIKNTLTKNWDDAFLNLLLAQAGNAVNAEADWATTSTTSIRRDINKARKAVGTAKTAEGAELGFVADCMVISVGTSFVLLDNEEFTKPYQGNVADENLKFTGVLPHKILGLNVLVTPRLNDGQVIVMQRNRAGFIADELALQASALYRDEPRKTWRSDVQRASAMGLDEPKAAAVIDIDV